MSEDWQKRAEALTAAAQALTRRAEAAEAQLAAAQEEAAKYRRHKDEAYEERNKVVRALASQFPSGVKRTDIPGWNPEWHGAVYIDLPTGQVSWHFHDRQAPLFADLPPYTGEWDGHDTPEKYRRLAALASAAPGEKT